MLSYRLRGFARTVPSFLMAYGNENTSASFYIPPQKTNQIFTPRPVVTKMLDLLEAENPGIFEDPTKTFADLYVKSGLYLTEIAKRLFCGLAEVIPDEQARLAHIFEHQLFGFAPTPIIFNIAKNFIFGFEGAEKLDTTHLYQLDLTPFAKGEKQLHDLPGGTSMKFDCIVGNPPFDETLGGTKKVDIWPHFEKLSNEHAEVICLIQPARWIVPKKQFKKFNISKECQKHINTCISDK